MKSQTIKLSKKSIQFYLKLKSLTFNKKIDKELLTELAMKNLPMAKPHTFKTMEEREWMNLKRIVEEC